MQIARAHGLAARLLLVALSFSKVSLGREILHASESPKLFHLVTRIVSVSAPLDAPLVGTWTELWGTPTGAEWINSTQSSQI